MSFKNAERVRRWRERQKSILAMETLAKIQGSDAKIPALGMSFAGSREKEPSFYKMRVTGPRTAQFVTTPPT
jgi:hypothetical protein